VKGSEQVSVEVVSPEWPSGASEPPSGTLAASHKLPKYGLGEQLIASSWLSYHTISSEQLVLVREPTGSIGVSCKQTYI